jgi:hypothetical protein
VNDFHWWMGLAPLLGFLLDALTGGTRLDDALESWVRTALPRARFVVRNAFGGGTALAGYALVIWLGGIALVVAWAVGVAGYVVSQEYGLFFVRALLFMQLFTARRLTARGIEALIRVSSGDLEGANASVRQLGPGPQAHDVDSLQGLTVHRMVQATLGAALIPLFWGVLGGSTLAAAALVVHLAAQGRPDDPEDQAPLWDAVARVDRWISTPAAWLGALVFAPTVTLVGGRRTAALAGFLGAPNQPPGHRLASGVAHGLGLRTREEDHLLVATGADVQKAVQLLFLGGFLCALLASAVSVFLHRVI